MEANAFVGRPSKPTEIAVASVLGETYDLWRTLVSELRRELKLTRDWHSSSLKMGWSLRLQRKERNIVYLSPREGWFLASFALGDKAIAALNRSDPPPALLKLIAAAKRYAEGTAVRIEVKKAEDLAVVKMLARIKVEN